MLLASAFRQTDGSAACFIHRLYTGWLGSERNKCFSVAEPVSALLLIAGSVLMVSSGFSRAFLLFDPAGDLQSALIHTVRSLDNTLAKLLITAVESPKGFK